MSEAGVHRPLGNVVVATDFSAAASRAVERAARLPLGPGSTLTVLHVYAPGCEPEEREALACALDRAAARAAECVRESGTGRVHVGVRLVEGTPFVEIVRAAREGRNELVVVGRHGRRTFRDLLLGSTAERVMRKGHVSVLVVGTPATAPYARPLVAIDLSECSRPALELTWRLVCPAAAKLDVVHAYEALSPAIIQRAGFSAEESVEWRLHAQRSVHAAVRAFLAGAEEADGAALVEVQGDARRVILDVAAERDADLVAVGTHGRSGGAHMLLGSVAETVAREARCDVLIAAAPGPPLELP